MLLISSFHFWPRRFWPWKYLAAYSLIAPIYPKTDLGKQAPLRRVDLDIVNQRVELARPVIYTPTFIFLEDNVEIARMEGYQSEDFFWALGEEVLAQHRAIEPAGE